MPHYFTLVSIAFGVLICFAPIALLYHFLSKHLVFVRKDNSYLYETKVGDLYYPKPGKLYWAFDAGLKCGVDELRKKHYCHDFHIICDMRTGRVSILRCVAAATLNIAYAPGHTYKRTDFVVAKRVFKVLSRRVVSLYNDGVAIFSEGWEEAMRQCAARIIDNNRAFTKHSEGRLDISFIEIAMGEKKILVGQDEEN